MLIERISRFEILAEVGQGGMSRVYLAYDPQEDRRVAIKILPSDLVDDLGFRARFERETELIASLENEAIVPVYDYGVHQSQPYIVMGYMSNGSLADRLLKGALSPEQTSTVLVRVASALQYAHSQGIIHCDLKPSNILFDQEDRAFLADFSIAQRAELSWQRNLRSGTPAYMSPEQALGEGSIDVRSDVYSLGIVTFEMLTGEPPFVGDSPLSIVLKQVYDPPPSLGAFTPDLSITLDPVLHRALAKDPEERYSSSTEFVEAFRNALQEAESGSRNTVVETQKPGVSEDEPGRNFADPGMDPELVISALTGQIRAGSRKQNFPGLLGLQNNDNQQFRRGGHYFFVAGFVTWLAVLIATLTVAAVRGQDLFAVPNVQLIYDESSFSLINISDKPIDLTDVSFQRLSDLGVVTAAFQAGQWLWVNPGILKGLPPGDCLQLLHPDPEYPALIPGSSPENPPGCIVSQGWLVASGQVSQGRLVASDEVWYFWTPDGGRESFLILLDERIIHACPISTGSCDVFLPGQK